MDAGMPVSARRAILPMQPKDVPAVAQIFYRAFRDGRAPDPGFADYFERLFFSSPLHSIDQASLVHRNADGHIDSALLVVPMAVRVHGRIITARLMSNYMTDPQTRTRGGADMVLTIRARNQDLCFSDSANPVSADHWKAVGGHVLPVQSLDFRRVFRPAAWWLTRIERRLPRWMRPGLRALAGGLDYALRRLVPKLRLGQSDGTPMARADFIAVAPELVQRFAVHPVWSPQELGWLLDMATENTAGGALHLRQVHDAKGNLCGCTAFYARRGGVARVLNVLARPGQEAVVIKDLLAHLDALGCVAVIGMALPFLIEALARQKHMGFVPRAFFCISTRHPDIVDAMQRGDAYLGGLSGEDWSRLVSDFHD